MSKQTKRVQKPKKNKSRKKSIQHHEVLLEPKDASKEFHHPTIGVLSIPMTASFQKNTHSYLPASYVKWLGMNNGRVIPIPYDTPKGALDMMLGQVNGVLFIGGQVDHDMISEEYSHFMETFKHIVNHAKKSNNQKNYFPLFAICLGFEILGMMNEDVSDIINDFTTLKGLSNVDAHKYNSKLDIVKPDSTIAKIFTSNEMEEFRKTSCVFQNHSQAFALDGSYMKKWKKSWNVVATSKSKDKTPIKFVSMLEYKNFPFYGVQFHPEKVLFEWLLTEIGHASIYRLISKKLSNFFINECAKNKNNVSITQLFIRNYNLWSRSAIIKKINPNEKLFKTNHSAFENSYYFDILS
jgi:gamma-glutamyl hydrolase